jgi:hypothetical protein
MPSGHDGAVMKRLVWLGIGAAAGASGTVWAQQKVRRRLDALGPDHLVVTAGNTAKKVGRNVRDAVSEGRSTMRDREEQLRAQRDGTPVARTVHRTSGPARPTRPASW